MAPPKRPRVAWLLALAAVAVAGCGDKPLTDLFRMRQLAPVGPAKSLVLGSELEAAKKANPALFNQGGVKDSTWGGDKGIRFEALGEGGRVQKLVITFSPDHSGVRDLLLQTFGEGTEAPALEVRRVGDQAKGEARPALYWFDPDAGLRVWYTTQKHPKAGNFAVLTYDYYQPLGKLLGPGDGPFAFETTPILGATAAELGAGYAGGFEAKGAKSGQLALAPTEWMPSTQPVFIAFEDGKAHKMELRFDAKGKPELKDELLGLLEARFGKPEVVENTPEGPWEEKTTSRFYQRRPRLVELKDWGGILTLTATTPPPAAIVIDPDAPVEPAKGEPAKGDEDGDE